MPLARVLPTLMFTLSATSFTFSVTVFAATGDEWNARDVEGTTVRDVNAITVRNIANGGQKKQGYCALVGRKVVYVVSIAPVRVQVSADVHDVVDYAHSLPADTVVATYLGTFHIHIPLCTL